MKNPPAETVQYSHNKSQVDSVLSSGSFEKITKSKAQSLEFPKYIVNIHDSFTYTKKLIVTAVSSILYLRGLFDEKYFVDRTFEGMNFKIIKPPTSGLFESAIISQWLHGSFDALEKKYLKRISLSIYENPDDPETVLETYDFGICYNGVDVEMSMCTTDAKKTAKKAKMNAFRLLRTIIFTSGTLIDLPMKICVTMRLFYYEDVTPVDYEPVGFESSDFEKYTFQNGNIRIDGHQADSYWHQVTFNIHMDNSMIKQMNDLEKINETFENCSIVGESDSGLHTTDQKSVDKEKMSKFKHIMDKTVDTLLDQTTVDDNLVYGEESDSLSKKASSLSSSNSEKIINCSCRLKDEVENLHLLRCESCKEWQHAICYNLLIEEETDLKFVIKNIKHNCFSCYVKNKDLILIDKNLAGNSEKKNYELSIWRRLVDWLTTIPYETEWLKITEIMGKLEATSSLVNLFVKELESKNILFSNKSKNKKDKAYRIDQVALKDFNIKNFQIASELMVDVYSQKSSNDSIPSKNPNKSVCFDLPDMSNDESQVTMNTVSSSRKSDRRTNGGRKFKLNSPIVSDDELEDEIAKLRQLSPKRQRKSSISKESLNFEP